MGEKSAHLNLEMGQVLELRSNVTSYLFVQDQKVEDRYGNYHQGKKLFECKDYHGIVVEENKVLIDEGNVQDHENSNKVEQKDTSNNKGR